MTLEHYNPAITEVLFEEIRETRTAGGLYIPSADFVLKDQSNFFETEKVIYDGAKSKLGKYQVVKAGTATIYQPGDCIVIRRHTEPETIELDEKTYFQVNMGYIIGYERK